jgi:acyl dehydratase
VNVLELIREQKEKLSDTQLDLNDFVSPQILEYWNEFWSSAKKSQWMKWRYDDVLEVGDNLRSLQEGKSSFHSVNVEAAWHELNASINKVSYVGEWFQVDQSRINQFAQASLDDQWIHTDPDRAKNESVFKSTIAHGFLTLSLLPKLTEASGSLPTRFSGFKMQINIGLNEVRFLAPVKAGARIRAIKKVTSLELVKRGMIVEEEVIVEIDGASRPACIARPTYRLVFQ